MQPWLSPLVSTNMKQLTNMKTLTYLTLSAFTISLFSSCINDTACIKGNNNQSTTSYTPTQFESISLDGSFDVDLRQGDEHQIVVTGDDNILDFFEYAIRNGNCQLSLEDGCYKNYDLKVEITTPNLEGIFLDGSGNIRVSDFENVRNLEVVLDGSGNIYFKDLNQLTNAQFTINGSGNIALTKDVGTVDNNVIEISGSGNYDGFKLISENVEARIDGSGNIETYAKSNLKARIFGSGSILYDGNPVIDNEITGSGTISKK